MVAPSLCSALTPVARPAPQRGRRLMDTEDVIDDQVDDQTIDDTIDHVRSCHATLLRLVLDKRAAQAASTAKAAAVAWMQQAPPLVRAAIQAGVAERDREQADRRVLASELHATEQLVARRSGLSTGDDGLQEAAALQRELAAARSAWAAERAALRARLRLLGEQHDAPRGAAAAGGGAAAAAGSSAAAPPRGGAAVAGGRAEAAGAQAASLTPSQDETAVASLRAAMLAAAQGGVSRCGCRHEDEAPASASTPTEPRCIKWHTRYKVA